MGCTRVAIKCRSLADLQSQATVVLRLAGHLEPAGSMIMGWRPLRISVPTFLIQRVIPKEIWHHRQVARLGVGVGQQARVDAVEAESICERALTECEFYTMVQPVCAACSFAGCDQDSSPWMSNAALPVSVVGLVMYESTPPSCSTVPVGVPTQSWPGSQHFASIAVCQYAFSYECCVQMRTVRLDHTAQAACVGRFGVSCSAHVGRSHHMG